jgi:hypothetical protein
MSYHNYNRKINAAGWRAEDARSFTPGARALTAAEVRQGSARMKAAAATWTKKERDGKVYWMNELTGVNVYTDPTLTEVA